MGQSVSFRHFFIDEISEDTRTLTISGAEAKHISKVLRMKPGDRFILMDGKGSRFLAVIESAASKEVLVVLEKPVPKPLPSPVHITLCQALPKSRAMDYLIQKTSELGVDRIVPFFSERTVVKYKKDSLINKMRHWHEVAISSAKQCGRGIPVSIDSPVLFSDVMEKWRGDHALKVVLWEEEESKDLKSMLETSPPAANFVGVIGPEGGFSEEEINAARDGGFASVSLGNRILRAETAAITTVAIVQYELGDLNIRRKD